MADFKRRVSPAGLIKLAAMSEADGNWWRDLLERWRPSGFEPSDRGLRLAIRNGYLNFYRFGQSVARIGFARNGTPAALTHLKYIDRGSSQKGMARLCEGFVHKKDTSPTAYGGNTMLYNWIDAAEEKSARAKAGEKVLVDQTVSANHNIIDLEMTLPATAREESAPRIDIVTLEPHEEDVRVVFWEAKTIDDNRLKTTKNGPPEVIKQVEKYQTYLSTPDRQAKVAAAYLNACKLFVDFAAMASRGILLGGLIQRVATGDCTLRVDPKPRLLLYDDGLRDAGHWAPHETLLRQKLHVQIIPPNGSHVLG